MNLLDSFIDILHSSIKKALEKGVDESVKSEAVQRDSGWMHINGGHYISESCTSFEKENRLFSRYAKYPTTGTDWGPR